MIGKEIGRYPISVAGGPRAIIQVEVIKFVFENWMLTCD